MKISGIIECSNTVVSNTFLEYDIESSIVRRGARPEAIGSEESKTTLHVESGREDHSFQPHIEAGC
jgi:hypothetical protein